MAQLINSLQQSDISQQRRLPVNTSGADTLTSVTGETVQYQYYNASGVLTTDAGQAAGVVVVAKLANNNILNQAGDVIGNDFDTSFAFTTGTILVSARRQKFPFLTAEKFDMGAGATKATAIVAGFTNGDWCIDHENGIIYGKKATTGTSDTGAYKVVKIATSSSGGGGGDVNLTEVAGAAVTAGAGAVAAGTLRTTLASNDPAVTSLQIMDDWDESDRAKVNPIVGQAGVAAGTGVDGATVQRVTLATNVALPAGTNNIGDVDVITLPALPAGTNNIGDVDVLSVPRSEMGPGQPGTAIDSYQQVAINLAAGADQVLVSSAASKQIWVYGYQISTNVAGTVSFQDEDNVALSGIMPFGITGGASVSPSGNFSMPIWKLGTDKDLEVDVVTSELDGWLTYAIVSV